MWTSVSDHAREQNEPPGQSSDVVPENLGADRHDRHDNDQELYKWPHVPG